MSTSKPWSHRTNGSVCHLQLHGKFDFNSFPQFRQLTAEVLELPQVREYVVDLSVVDYIDSSALGMLLNFNDALSARGGRLVLEHARGLAAQILKIANFDKIVEVR